MVQHQTLSAFLVQIKLEMRQVKSVTHIPKWTGKILAKTLLSLTYKISQLNPCMGQIYLTVCQIKFVSDTPEGSWSSKTVRNVKVFYDDDI